jgi:hypothetical protein
VSGEHPDANDPRFGNHVKEEPLTPKPGGELYRTHAELMAQEAEKRLELRRLALAEQSSAENPPDVRVRAWEKVHALRLPSDARHPVLQVIAHGTGLTLEQVREEQQARAARSPTVTAARGAPATSK